MPGTAVESSGFPHTAYRSDLVNGDVDLKNEGRFLEGREGPGPIPLNFPLHIPYFGVENIIEKVKVELR